jgi:sugar phosphate isomerase/epimerase
LLTIPFEKARQEAVKWAKKTLEHASCLDAKVVILHLGEVGEPGNAFKQIQSNLTREYKGGEITLKEMKLRIKALFKERNSQAGAYLEASKRSLAELLNFAVKKKIKLALETRYFFHQIPNFEEIGVLLEEFKSENLGYWHDCGHAQLSENLGLTRHEEFLEAYQERLIGIHLHDIKFDTDHLAPFKGELNFSLLRKYVQGNVAKILEVNQAQTQAEVMLAIKKLRALKII